MLVLDFAKAFDTVAHERLLEKVENYGITNGLQNWIRSFLEGRTQRVVVDGKTSDAAAVKSGVPQGSVLGPLLFLIFINDLAEHTSTTVCLFADHCVMYRQIDNVHDCKVLQEDFNQLHEWEERWQLKFKKAKCNIMRSTHARQKKIADVFLIRISYGGLFSTIRRPFCSFLSPCGGVVFCYYGDPFLACLPPTKILAGAHACVSLGLTPMSNMQYNQSLTARACHFRDTLKIVTKYFLIYIFAW